MYTKVDLIKDIKIYVMFENIFMQASGMQAKTSNDLETIQLIDLQNVVFYMIIKVDLRIQFTLFDFSQ